MDTNDILFNLGQLVKNWYWIPLALLYIMVIATILIENRNPPKTIAWILVIIFLPVIGIVIYFFFGQKFKREQFFRRFDESQRRIVEKRWDKMENSIQEELDEVRHQIGDLTKVFRYLNTVRVAPPSLHNEVQLLINGEEKFPLFLETIQNAKEYIHVEYYIFEEDEIGNQIIELLIDKAQNGVEVRVMVDDFGSPKLNKHQKRFEGTKVEFQTFLPVHFNSLANSNYRNHRKILIVDSKIAFVGGINISDKYINLNDEKNPKNKVYWRDTSVMIKGNAVNILQLHFYNNWMMTEGKPYNPFEAKYFYHSEENNSNQHAVISYGLTSPGDQVHSAMEAMILGITLAKKKVQICTPYFIPSDEFKTALMIAASTGIEVELIIPEKGDSIIVQQAALSFLKPLLKRGVKVYLYQKGFIHSKTITIDDQLAYIGTVNLDSRSFFINFEITSVIHDKNLLEKMAHYFEIDRNNSVLIALQDWENRPWYHRAFASICRLLAPIL